MRRIAIIGGGWYGCHVALTLKQSGHDVQLFEARSRLFDGASGNNQNRLHLGFHYARDWVTRQDCRRGFGEFVARYGELTREVEHNVYAVAANGRSHLDFGTYRDIMRASGLSFQELPADSFGLQNCEGAIRVAERVIRFDDARHFFYAQFAEDELRLNETVADPLALLADFDAVIDATHGAFGTDPGSFEVCLTLALAAARPDLLEPDRLVGSLGLTIMDGPFLSIYPDGSGGATLTHVELTRLAAGFPTRAAAAQWLASLDAENAHRIAEARAAMLRDAEYFVADFARRWRVVGQRTAIRFKHRSASDARRFGARVWPCGAVLSITPGKIGDVVRAGEVCRDFVAHRELVA